MSNARILLYRHGKVDFDAGKWVKASNIHEAVREYDAAPLLDELAPETAFKPDILVCSSLKRSIDSAAQLFRQPDVIDHQFREAELPSIVHLPLTLPVKNLFIVARCIWLLGGHKDCEGIRDFKTRVHDAASTLDHLSKQHQQVAVIGHGIFNSYLARELLRLGFNGPKRPTRLYGHGSCFERARN